MGSITKMSMKRTIISLSMAAMLGACAMGTDYKRPAVQTPEAFRGAPVLSGKSLADMAWWEVYQDPALDKLLRAADRKSTRLNSSHSQQSRMPSSA